MLLLHLPCLPACLAGVDLHFWDSPDDIQGASMDLLFERDRVYLHKATGSFGAIPLSVSGERGCSPQSTVRAAGVGEPEIERRNMLRGKNEASYPSRCAKLHVHAKMCLEHSHTCSMCL